MVVHIAQVHARLVVDTNRRKRVADTLRRRHVPAKVRSLSFSQLQKCRSWASAIGVPLTAQVKRQLMAITRSNEDREQKTYLHSHAQPQRQKVVLVVAIVAANESMPQAIQPDTASSETPASILGAALPVAMYGNLRLLVEVDD